MPTIDILDADGVRRTINTMNPNGAASAATSSPVTDAAAVATNLAVGAKVDTSATDDTGAFSVIAFIKRGLANWATLLARIPVLGQALAAASHPAVLPAAQEAALRNAVTTSNAPTSFTGTASAQVFALNTSRRRWSITNQGPGTLYVLEGTGTASPSNYSGRPLPVGASASSDPGSGGQPVQATFGSAGTALLQEHF